jgi:LPXTG-motif cell wall-anchored protein
VRHPVRKLMGLAVMGILGALFAVPMVAAGAQTVDAGACTITSIQPPSVPVGGGIVTVTGTAPEGSTVIFYVNGAPVTPAVTQLVGADLQFSIGANVVPPASVSVSYLTGPDAYPLNACLDVSGESVFNITVSPASVNKPAAQALAFTGSNDTPSYVLVGIAALVLGGVLVLAARRRSQVS